MAPTKGIHKKNLENVSKHYHTLEGVYVAKVYLQWNLFTALLLS